MWRSSSSSSSSSTTALSLIPHHASIISVGFSVSVATWILRVTRPEQLWPFRWAVPHFQTHWGYQSHGNDRTDWMQASINSKRKLLTKKNRSLAFAAKTITLAQSGVGQNASLPHLLRILNPSVKIHGFWTPQFLQVPWSHFWSLHEPPPIPRPAASPASQGPPAESPDRAPAPEAAEAQGCYPWATASHAPVGRGWVESTPKIAGFGLSWPGEKQWIRIKHWEFDW